MYKLNWAKAEELEIKLPTSIGIIEKARELQKNIYFCFIDYTKGFDYVDHNKLWKILKELGIPDHLTCLLRNVYAGQEATVRIRHRTTDWVKISKWVCSRCMLSPCLFNLYAEYIKCHAERITGGIKTAGRNINNFIYADDNYFNGRKWRGTKEPLVDSERGEWKSCLNLVLKKKLRSWYWSHHFIQNRRGKGGSSDRFPFLGL